MQPITTMTTIEARHTAGEHRRFCSTCGYQNPANVDICLNCMAPLGVHCPACGQTLPHGSKFCGQCGTPLAAQQRPAATSASQGIPAGMPTALVEKIKSASVKLPGECREVTVLFVDVANFTAVSHNLDSEEVYLFVDEAMSLLAEVVYQYEGTIDKFTGDGLMALFGAPVAHENSPERAIRAALDMQAVIQPLQQRLKQTCGFDFQIRVGINTGAVIAGRVGNDHHMEYTVIGDTVNLASRLEEAAEPGTVLVSAETYQRTSPLFEFETLSPFTVKGIPEPLQAYRPVGLLERLGRVRGFPGLQVSMVGRSDDLIQLQTAMAAVHHQQQRRIVLITGEAGVGKSRLVAEFQQTLAQADVQMYLGGCVAYARSRPLWVVAELLRDMLPLTEADSASAQRDTLRSHLDQLKLATAEIWPYLAHVLGLAQTDPEIGARLELLDAEMLQRQTHTALRRLILAHADQRPTVFVFEDLHWVDPASREFLEYLIQTTSGEPLMVLLVSRQIERSTALRFLLEAAEQEPGQLVALPLQALPVEEREQLVDQIITQSSPEAQALKQSIAERSEGNPFFVEEMIRMLIDQGGLVRPDPDGAWQITPQGAELLGAVPGTVKDLILARVDGLPERLRQTLQQAAVVGSSFPVSLLGLLNGLSPKSLAAHLHELEHRQFLVFKPFKSEPGYTFQHALLHGTVYSTLLKRDRRQLHSQVAQAIEQSESWLSEEKIEALAFHYAESTSPTKAIPYLISAAESTARRCAYETAIDQYLQAMALLPDRPDGQSQEFFQVRLGLGRSLKFVGELAAADQLLSESLQLLWGSDLAAEAATLRLVLVEHLLQLADIRQREGSYDEALAYLETGLQLLGEAGTTENPRLWGLLIERQAWIHFRQGRLERAFDLADTAVQLLEAEENDDPVMLAKLLNTLGGISWQQGNRDRAIDYTRRSLELFESIGYVWGVATAHNNLGLLYDVLGNWAKGIEYHEQAYAIQKDIGDIQGQARSLDNLGILHMIMGEHKTARRKMETSLAIRQKLGDRFGMAQSQASLAELALIQNRFKKALSHAESALTLADGIESPEIQTYARWILALVQAEQGHLETGLEFAQDALEMARIAGHVEGEADCLRVLGVLRFRTGQYDEAEAMLQNSVDLAVSQNDPYRQGLALLELGHAYQALTQTDQSLQLGWRTKAVVVLNQAIEKFNSLGAAYQLHLAQTALSQLQITDSDQA